LTSDFQHNAAGIGGDNDVNDLKNLLAGYQITQILYAACELKLVEHINDGIDTDADLAKHVGVEQGILTNILNCLTALGIMRFEGDRRCTTSLGSFCDSRNPASLAHTILLTGRHRYQAWEKLIAVLRTGKPAFPDLAGDTLHDYYASQPEAASHFNEAMACLTKFTSPCLVRAYNFGMHELVIDVGGGLGGMMTAVLSAYPHLRGIVFDLPHVIAQARHDEVDPEIAHRYKLLAGDARTRVPEGGDCYITKMVLCDFADEEALSILGAIRQAIRREGRLVILDRIHTVASPSDMASMRTTMSALNLAVMTGGRERTHDEYEALLKSANFSLTSAKRCSTPTGDLHMMVGIPALSAEQP
jgi:O-methyltransferase domain/Dimerisation domain